MINRKIAPVVHDAVDFHFQLPLCRKDTLANGIPVYWLSAGTQDVVQIEWIFKAGLWGEAQKGLAHTTAGLLKNGTIGKSAEAINEALEFYGASLRSVANNDYSSLVLHCLTKYLDKILPVIREIILEATFPDREWEIYQKNALQHLSVNLKKVDFVANREAEAQLFGYDHPYGRFTLKEDFLQIKPEHLRSFHRQYYRADNCQVFMAGNIDEHHLMLLSQYFGRENWGTQTSDNAKEQFFSLQPGNEKKLRLRIEEKSLQGAVRILRRFPTREHPDFAPMIILNTLLGGYFGSRLMANIREEKGYTYGIYSLLYAYQKESCLLIATEAGKEVCDAVIEETWKELDQLCQEPVSKEELSLVKNYLFGSLLGDLDGPFNLIRRWKNLILNGFSEEQFYENLEIYKKIQAEELQALAQKYFRKDDFYEILVV